MLESINYNNRQEPQIIARPAGSKSQMQEIFDISVIPLEVQMEFPKGFSASSKRDMKEFIGIMRVMYLKSHPELYLKSLCNYIDYHRIPIAKLPLNYEHILEIVPHLRYLDLSNLDMVKEFGFKEGECLKKYTALIEKCQAPVYLCCAGGITAGSYIHKSWDDHHVQTIKIPLDDAVLQSIGQKTSLKSLNLSGCQIETGESILMLENLTNLEYLYLKNLAYTQGQYLSNPLMGDEHMGIMPQLKKLQELVIDLSFATNAGLQKLAACTELKALTLTCCGSQTEFVDDDFEFLESFTELKELRLERFQEVSDRIVSKLKSIQKLSFKNVPSIFGDFVHQNPGP